MVNNQYGVRLPAIVLRPHY